VQTIHSVVAALDGFGGIYFAMFVIAILSGIFPLTNSELALGYLGAATTYSIPKLVLLAVIVAVGQHVTHGILFFSGRGIAKGAENSPKLEAKIAKAHKLAEKWQKSEITLMFLGATIGIPPQALVALVAGIVGIRYPVFAAIDLTGRIGRFTVIVLVAHYV
jgi:membrane protein DedA with SNARE-associated domain